jgi:hypothetical protein
MPKHHDYISLTETFARETAVASASFPLSVTVMEMVIRHFLDEHFEVFNAAVVNLSRTQTLRRRLGALQYWLSHAAAPVRTAAVYTDLRLFPLVERTVAGFARQNTLRLCGPSWNNPGKDYLPVSTLALAGDAFATCNRLMAEQGTLEVLSDWRVMTRLEAQLERNRRALTAALRRKQICGIVVQDDSKPAHRLLALAARAAGVPMVVMAHGYIQAPSLNSIAPVYANHLVVWSKAQKDMLRCKAPELRQSDVLKCFGFPYGQLARDPMPRKVLALLSPVTSFTDHELHTLVKRLSRIARQAHECGLFLCVKPHPKDVSDVVTMHRFHSADLETVSGRLQDLLPETALTIGMDSSGLLESQYIGIPTYHLSQYKTLDFEGVPTADADHLDISALARADVASAMVPFREDAFEEFLARTFRLNTIWKERDKSFDSLEREHR